MTLRKTGLKNILDLQTSSFARRSFADCFFYVVYFLIVVLSVYSDSPLYGMFSQLAFSPSFIICLILLPLIFVFKKRLVCARTIIYLYALLVWIFVSSLVNVAIYAFANGLYIGSVNVLVKTFNLVLTWLAKINVVFVCYNLIKDFDIKKIALPFQITFIGLVLLSIVELKTAPYAFSFLHATAIFPYWRVRLLWTESSFTTFPLILYFLISLYYSWSLKKSLVLSLINIGAFFFFVSVTGAKSMFFALGLTWILFIFISLKKTNGTKKLFYLALLVLTVVGLILFSSSVGSILSSVFGGYDNSLSFTTRFYTGYVGIIHGIIYPFGTGGIYLYTFQQLLSSNLFIFDSLPFTYNLSEINTYIMSTDGVNVAVKSGLGQYTLYWGGLGSIFFIYHFSKNNRLLYRDCLPVYLTFIAAFVCILFYGDISIEIMFLILIKELILKKMSHDNRFPDVRRQNH